MGQRGGPDIPLISEVLMIDSKNPRSNINALISVINNVLGSVTGTTIAGSGNSVAYTFSASTNKIDFSDLASLKFTSALTISSWIYPNTFGGTNAGRIYDKWQTTVPQSGYSFFIDNNTGTNAIAFGTGWVISTSVARVNNVITLNGWQHVAVTFSGSACTFYKNGYSVGTVTGITAPTSGTVSAIVGNNTSNSNYFDGKIDGLIMYSRGLSAAEINKIYTSTKTRYGL
jgi:hypothetical protein